jgi:hypothetical protein
MFSSGGFIQRWDAFLQCIGEQGSRQHEPVVIDHRHAVGRPLARWRVRVWLVVPHAFFRWQTGLRVRRLPAFESILEAAGLVRTDAREFQSGPLRSTVFRLASEGPLRASAPARPLARLMSKAIFWPRPASRKSQASASGSCRLPTPTLALACLHSTLATPGRCQSTPTRPRRSRVTPYRPEQVTFPLLPRPPFGRRSVAGRGDRHLDLRDRPVESDRMVRLGAHCR